MWGWSFGVKTCRQGPCVFPMYVGVILKLSTWIIGQLGIPHVCGGDPWSVKLPLSTRLYSPCMWGWSYFFPTDIQQPVVFPMYVGVILISLLAQLICIGIPHVCGGDPFLDFWRRAVSGYSPCMWGWSSIHKFLPPLHTVFPMYVGVILVLISPTASAYCIPHVCGGDPLKSLIKPLSTWYSPCMWGWSFCYQWSVRQDRVFPMYVGVILDSWEFGSIVESIPHVCGGDPHHRN